MYRSDFFTYIIFFSTIFFAELGVFSPSRVDAQALSESERELPERLPYFTRRLKLSTAGGIASLGLGLAISFKVDEIHRNPVFGAPPGLDRFFRDRFHVDGKETNFLNHYGSFYTISGSLTAMILMQRLLMDDSTWHHTAYETTVFGVGLMTELGLRAAVKSSFARHRPLLEFADATAVQTQNAKPNNHLSFYSGHASTAFYTAAYVDQKIGDLLRARNASRLYRALSILSLYGWASYSAYSRIEIDKHYFTDVFTGGAVGTAWGIWHYRFHHGPQGPWAVLPAFDRDYVGMMIRRSY